MKVVRRSAVRPAIPTGDWFGWSGVEGERGEAARDRKVMGIGKGVESKDMGVGKHTSPRDITTSINPPTALTS